jgi:hypothetical protein
MASFDLAALSTSSLHSARLWGANGLPATMKYPAIDTAMIAGNMTRLGRREPRCVRGRFSFFGRSSEPDWTPLARELKRPGVSLMVLWQEYRQIAGKPVLLRCGSRAARNPALCYVQFGARTTAVKPHFDSLFDSGLVLHSGELPTSFLGRCHLLRI